MIPEFFVARRFAFRQRSRSRPTFIVMIAVIGIAVGTTALILTLSVVKGFASSIEQKLIGFSSHMQFRYPDERLFAERRMDHEVIASHPEVISIAPFLEKSLVIRSRQRDASAPARSGPVMLRGMTKEECGRFFDRYLDANAARVPLPDGVMPLYVGKSLAEELHLQQGDRVLLIGTADDRQSSSLISGAEDIVSLLSALDIEVGFVAGIYDTGLQEGFDDFVLITGLEAMQHRFAPSMISGYDARVRDLERVGDTVAEIGAHLGYPFYGYTVYQRYANLFEWLKLQKNITPLLVVTITIVAVFNIISTLLVLIIEKTREIGMLGALGLSPARISMVFMGQAVFIAFAGIVLGNVLALTLTYVEQRFHFITLPEKSYFITHVPLHVVPLDHLFISLAVMLLSLVFAFVPARVASSLKPGKALGS